MVIKASTLFSERNGEAEWREVLDAILKALDPYPEARLAVAEALSNYNV